MECSTLTEQARHWASTQPDKIWMRDLHEGGADEYTWGETVAEIDRVASWLEAEFGEGQRMALLSRNRAHWIMADMAVIHSGNVTVPLFTTHATATAEYILDFTETKVLFLGQTENWAGVKTVLPKDCLLVTLPGVECDLPHKTCAGCGLDFAWRKKWERDWDNVKYCSDRCRRSAKTASGAA